MSQSLRDYGSRGRTGDVEGSSFQRKLHETAQLARKNEDIAGEVLDEMKCQRETLNRAHEDLTVMESLSLSAKEMISTIQSKTNKKEIILKAIMVLLFLLDLTLIIVVIKNGGSIFSRK